MMLPLNFGRCRVPRLAIMINFAESLQGKAKIVPSIKVNPVPCPTFPIHYLLQQLSRLNILTGGGRGRSDLRLSSSDAVVMELVGTQEWCRLRADLGGRVRTDIIVQH